MFRLRLGVDPVSNGCVSSSPISCRWFGTGGGPVLIAVIDADTDSTEARRTQLQRQCAERGIEALRVSDPVLVVVPRRSIETWFHYLSGHEFDETTRYPHLRREADCEPLADRLFDMCHKQQKLDEPAPASLVEACREYPRLTGLLQR